MKITSPVGLTAIVSAYLLIGNGLAYLSVAADYISGKSSREAAIHSLMNDTPIVNSIGYSIAHKKFYGNFNYKEEALKGN